MKEESKVKKTSAKKPTTKKTAVKKNVTKKTTTKKAPVKKTTTKKSATKTSTSSKTNKRVISVITNEELNKQETIKTEESTYDKELLLRMILIIAYTLIIAILLMGFIESYTNNLKVTDDYKPSYIVTEEILNKKNVLKLDSAEFELSKLNGDYFVYIGYTKINNKDVELFEMGLANLIDKYDLKDKFYYVNIDSIIKEKNCIELVNKYLGYSDVLVSKVPTILYVNEDNIIRIENIITREDNKMITVGDFQKLLDINQFVAKK